MSGLDDDIMMELITESKEHLEAIEPDLLVLEQEGSNVEPELVNRIFRAMHSIKGGFGFFGMTNIKELSHRMESVLMRVRDGEITVTQEMVDALLAGTDKLRVMIDDVAASQEMSIEEELAPLEAFLGETPPAKESPKTEIPAEPVVEAAPPEMEAQPEESAPPEAETLPEAPSEASLSSVLEYIQVSPDKIQDALKHGKHVYILHIDLKKDLADQQLSGADYIKNVSDLGEYLGSDINLAEWTAESSDSPEKAKVLYSSVLEFDLVVGTMGLDEDQVEEVDIKKDLPKKSPATAEKTAAADKAAPSAGKAAPSPAAKSAGSDRQRDSGAESIRVKVDLLNSLMNLAGELVLGRNQIKQALGQRLSDTISSQAAYKNFENSINTTHEHLLDGLKEIQRRGEGNGNMGRMVDQFNREFGEMVGAFRQFMAFRLMDLPGLAGIVQNVDMVTSELQGDIMNTRMQPVGAVFNKFPRIIRDMARNLNKEIELTIEGQDVELDKSIIEALGDPLTHLIRNSADHGIESPEVREEKGKPRQGSIKLRAYHEGGQVNIDIIDDGAGIDADKLRNIMVEKGIMSPEAVQQLSEREALGLIFRAGLSTAEQVSDLSGRGVGMDVVKTNIEKLGGVVEVESTLGKGTRINLKLPLTLAIIPSLIVASEDRTYAVPQVNLEELVRIRAREVRDRIESIQGKPVLRLREKLLPLVRLSDVLGLPRTYVDASGEKHIDRRERIADRRTTDSLIAEDPEALKKAEEAAPDAEERAEATDRRHSSRSAMNILVLKVGMNRYGLIVDKLLDNEEIVVKPLSNYLKSCKCYAGATIMGDGSVSMILDAVGIADQADLKFGGDLEKAEARQADQYMRDTMAEAQSLLLFRNSTSELFAINLALVSRIEKTSRESIHMVGNKEYLKYDDYSLRILRLHDFLPIQKPEQEPEQFFVIVPKLVRHPMGIVVSSLEDIVETAAAIDRQTITGTGILGSMVLKERLTIIVDIYSLFEKAEPEIYTPEESVARSMKGAKVLLAEDTGFFRVVEKEYLESLGLIVEAVTDGQQAWERLNSTEEYDLLVTDIVMPRMDGMELSRRVRASERLMELPIIALTSLESDRDREEIKQAGVDAYERKLDKDKLRLKLEDILEHRR